MKKAKSALLATVLIFFGCDSSEVTRTDCLEACKANWSADQAEKCPNLISDIQSACLETGSSSCKLIAGKVNGPLPSCDNPLLESNNGKTSTEFKDKVNISFDVVKIDVTDGHTYSSEISKLKVDYPAGTIYLPSSPTAPSISYLKTLKVLHSGSKPDQFNIRIAASTSSKAVTVTSYKDNWYQPKSSDAVVTGVDDCGNRLPIRNSIHVMFDEVVDAQPRWDFDWPVNLFKNHPAVKDYNIQYKSDYGFYLMPAVYIMNARGVFTRRNREGTCMSKDLDYSLLESLKSDPVLNVIPLSNTSEKDAHGSPDVGWYTFGEAMAYKGVHTPIITLYMNNITDPKYLSGTSCADWQDLFVTTLSHELGHFLFTKEHVDDKTSLMAAGNTCQSALVFPFQTVDKYGITSNHTRPWFTSLDYTIDQIWMP